MYKVGICGHLGGDKINLDGQTVKTKIIIQQLINIYRIKILDTVNSKKRILNILFGLIKLLIQCENIIILPAENGLKIMVPFLVVFNKIFKRKLHYIVIGGWLPDYIRNKHVLSKFLKCFNYIYVETNMMKTSLEKQLFNNIYVMPNCKMLNILSEKELVYPEGIPYKLCTFSRVIPEKGIEEAVKAVCHINSIFNYPVFSLDIYGQIDIVQKKWFDKLQTTFPNYVQYIGVVPFDKTVEILKNYCALLFPTYYKGEGFAGTLIDAFSAGVPIIASDWKYNSEIVIPYKNGLLIKGHEILELVEALKFINENIEFWKSMKIKCLESAKNYKPESVIKILLSKIDDYKE